MNHVVLIKYPKLVIFLCLLTCFPHINSEKSKLVQIEEACREYFNTAYTHNYAKYLQFYSKHDTPSDSTTFDKWCKILSNLKIVVDGVEKKSYNSTSYYRVLVSAYTKDGKQKVMERIVYFADENGKIVIVNWKFFTKDWKLFRSKYFNIYSRQIVSDSMITDIDNFYEDVTQELGVQHERIDYYLCKDKEEAGLLQGKLSSAGGTCFPGKTKTIIAPALSYHEIVHAITYAIIDVSMDFLVEGVATYYTFIWEPQKLDSIIDELRLKNQLVPLDTLMWKFRSIPEDIAYFEAASFVKFLITNYGIKSFVALYKGAKSWDSLVAALHEIYGKALNEINDEWLLWLTK
ncbi:MAG: hypothetical protein ABIL39_03875 [candidate division WOR-3 bacterium]